MNKDIIKRLEERYKESSHTYQSIMEVILEYEKPIFDLRIEQFANEAFCSKSTIIKFINSLGYKSYKVFLYELNLSDNNFSHIINSITLVENYMRDNNNILTDMTSKINSAKNIFLFGQGHSFTVLNNFYLLLTLYKFKNIHVNEFDNPDITSEDIVIVISNSGRSNKIALLLSHYTNINTFLITNRNNSPIQKLTNNLICLNNNIESSQQFKEFPKESKYSLIYFIDEYVSKYF